MNRVLNFILFFLTISVSVAYAQDPMIKGRVTDNQNQALIQASVFLQSDHSVGTVTDMNGNYQIAAKPGDVLVFSYIGYLNKKVKVKPGVNVINVSLNPDSQSLQGTVVTALGIKRSQKALSYNVQEVKGNVINQANDANFASALNGRIAGVNIQKSSVVGGGVSVVMRGNKSILGSNNVLYVIDGIPFGNQSNNGGGGVGFGGSAPTEGISSLNQDDIASITVLTGPSAAALYGAAAANGVILITTKKGKAGRIKINISSSTEASRPFILPKFQNIYGNSTGSDSYTSWGDRMQSPRKWQPKDFFNTGLSLNNSLSLSTGTKQNQTFFSLASVQSYGFVPNNDYHRYNANIRNTSQFLNNKFVLDLSASYAREFRRNMVSYGTYFNPLMSIYLYPVGSDFNQEKYFERYAPQLGYYSQYWSPGDMGLGAQNPYWIVYRNLRPQVSDRYSFYASLRYNITDWMNITARGRIDNTYGEYADKRFATTNSIFAGPNGRYRFGNTVFRQKYADVILNINKSFLTDYNIVANVGSSYEQNDLKGIGYGGDLLTVPNLFSYSNVDPTKASSEQPGGNSFKANLAFFFSGELSWKQMLYLTVTGRSDRASTLVNSKTPMIFYPSVGLSGIITEMLPENVQNTISPVLSYLKLRSSYTEVGSPIPFTGITPGTQTHEVVGGVVQPYKYYPVKDLRGERTKSYEFGLDSRWFGGALNFNLTFYHSNTYNQLLKAPLAKSSGYQYMFVQSGNVQNQGVEMTLALNLSAGDFNSSTNVTATHNSNKIIKLASDVTNPIDGSKIDLSQINMGRFILKEGGQIGDVYCSNRLARDKENYISYVPGQALQVENCEPYKLGSVNPDWIFGFGQTFSYKNLSFSFLINARIGGIVISKTQAYIDQYGTSLRSAQTREKGIVIGTDRSAANGLLTIPAKTFYAAVVNIDAYNTYSATNVRLQSMRLTYKLPRNWFKKVDASLSIYGSNLIMFYNRAPYDPEIAAGTGTFGLGYDEFLMPSARTVGLGLNLKF